MDLVAPMILDQTQVTIDDGRCRRHQTLVIVQYASKWRRVRYRINAYYLATPPERYAEIAMTINNQGISAILQLMLIEWEHAMATQRDIIHLQPFVRAANRL